MQSTISFDSMQASAQEASQFLKVLANPDRLLLLCKLQTAELTVGELEEQLGIKQPTLSQQLGVLRDKGLVATRREGKYMYYRLASPQVVAVIAVLYQQFCDTKGEE